MEETDSSSYFLNIFSTDFKSGNVDANQGLKMSCTNG